MTEGELKKRILELNSEYEDYDCEERPIHSPIPDYKFEEILDEAKRKFPGADTKIGYPTAEGEDTMILEERLDSIAKWFKEQFGEKDAEIQD